MRERQTVLIYGANGYSGALIAKEAAKQDLKPILAGRNKNKLSQLAEELDCEFRCFSLNDIAHIAASLQDIHTVIHCAGPFSSTSEPMLQACLESTTHYLDITGEISVFERIQELDDAAQQAGIVLCSGVGFDVIPTDCIAAQLKAALPNAVSLSLGFDTRSPFSPGTAKTSIEGLGMGGKIRKDGNIVSVPLAYRSRTIDFGDGEKMAITIPWGDISTAYHSTGIANIDVYIPLAPKKITQLKKLNKFRPLLKMKIVQKLLQYRIGKTIKGPSEEKRKSQETFVWGEAHDDEGRSVTARIKTANPYDVTTHGALAVLKHVQRHSIEGGSYTPSELVDASLVTRLPGSEELKLKSKQD